MRLTSTCPHCKRIAEVESESHIGDYISKKLVCGHTLLEKLQVSSVVQTNDPTLQTKLQKALFEYQVEGREFIERSNFRMLLADDMGLGKTIQALAALERSNLTPYVIICKGSLAYNWLKEFQHWMRPDFPRPIIHATKDAPFPGFNGYIISMDVLSSPAIIQFLTQLNPQLVIIDEAHNFKNAQSKRTMGLNRFLAGVKNLILLTGTPLMNRLSEYWTILNILRPDHWPSLKNFLWHWVDYDPFSKRYLGITSSMRDKFVQQTSGYILRRTKSQVRLQLPEFIDCYEYTSDITPALKKSYGAVLKEIEVTLDIRRNNNSLFILTLLQKLWGIAGLAKVPHIAEQAIDFLDNTEPDRKLCIGVHHQDVTLYLETLLAKYNPIVITGRDSAEAKQRKEDLFRRPENRLCIMSIIAGGEGRNMQFCDTAMLAEQYWVPAKIAQFKGRFHRVGSTAACVSMTAYYLKDSIDEYFQELLELKEKIVATALSTDNPLGELTPGEIMELAHKVVKVRSKYV